MTDVSADNPRNPDAITALEGKLQQANLTEEERHLLADIFEIAQEAISRPARDGLIRSYSPEPPPDVGLAAIHIRQAEPPVQ